MYYGTNKYNLYDEETTPADSDNEFEGPEYDGELE